jgi:hypothetical protein
VSDIISLQKQLGGFAFLLSAFLGRRKVVNHDLGNFLKIAVGCENREPVLHGAGGNPDIVATGVPFFLRRPQ